MRKIFILIPILLSLSGVFAISCADQCSASNYEAYNCINFDYTGQDYCLSGDYRYFCHSNFLEVFGTTCGTRCWCHNQTACGVSYSECTGSCTPTGCTGTCGMSISSISTPTNGYQYDTSTVSVNIHHDSGIGCLVYAECQVRDPSSGNHFINDGCEVSSGSSTTQLNPSIVMTQLGTYSLLSCTIFEAEGDSVCSTPYTWKDENDYFPYYTWTSSSPSCPPSAIGYCLYSQVGQYTCFGNYRARCDAVNGAYCWTSLGDCSPLICSGGSCVSVVTTTTIVGTTTTTTISGTTTTTVALQDLNEPFNTADMPNELKFLSNLASGVFNMSTSIMVGLFLLVFSLSVATIIIIIGKRSLQ